MNVALVNLLPACSTAQWRQRIVTASATNTPVNLTTVSLSGITSSDGIATATASAAHGFLAGDTVTIAGATPTDYNLTVEILSVPSTTTFTYAVLKGIATAASGTLTAKADLWYRTATFIGNNAVRTANTGTVYLGLSSTNDTQPRSITTGASLTLAAVEGSRLNLADLWLDVATANDGVLIWFH